jgi:hypothetical protein
MLKSARLEAKQAQDAAKRAEQQLQIGELPIEVRKAAVERGNGGQTIDMASLRSVN